MFDNITKWKDKIAQYIDVRVRLVKLSIIDRTSKLLSYFIFLIIGLFLLLAVLIFFGLGLAEYFSDLTASRTCGYFITTGIYTFLMVLLFAFRKQTIKNFANRFIHILTEEDEDIPDDDHTTSNNQNSQG